MPRNPSRREAAFFMPGAAFWGLWARIGIVIALVCLAMVAEPAHAATRHWHVRHHVAHADHRARRARGRAVRFHPIVNGRSDAVSIALRYLGSGNPTGTRGPWCGDFMNFVERLAGRPGIRSRMASAWASYGRPSAPVPGAIAVQRGHVALVMRRLGNRVQIISGNWSRKVGIGWISLRSAAYRMP